MDMDGLDMWINIVGLSLGLASAFVMGLLVFSLKYPEDVEVGDSECCEDDCWCCEPF